MPPRHVIRLRGPWQYQPLARTVLLPDGTTCAVQEELPPPGTMHIPNDWGGTLGDQFFGRVRFTRRFGKPTGLGPGDRVELVLARVDAWADVLLDDLSIGHIPLDARDTRFEIQNHLSLRNRLIVEVELPRQTTESPPLPRGEREGKPGGIVGEVTLEITPSA